MMLGIRPEKLKGILIGMGIQRTITEGSNGKLLTQADVDRIRKLIKETK
jgi:hypothetical protein